jgi:glucosamine-phosphate N-acetyltransferase
MLIDHCVEYGKLQGCYKIILNCEEKNIKFYEKCGFKYKNVEMSCYI